jgi:hypothetical protein
MDARSRGSLPCRGKVDDLIAASVADRPVTARSRKRPDGGDNGNCCGLWREKGDPWRSATPHSRRRPGSPKRSSQPDSSLAFASLKTAYR